MMDKVKFEFSEAQIRKILIDNGWKTVWTENNWIHPNTTFYIDGLSMLSAFRHLLREKGIDV